MSILYDYLNKILKKTGKTKIEELTPAEQRSFAEWEEVFKRPDITVKDIKDLLKKTREESIDKIKNPDIDYNSNKDVFHKSMISLCDIVVKFIETPNQAKIDLERHIRNLSNRIK